MHYIFWNAQEQRLRAGWRVLLQLLLVSVPITILGLSGLFSLDDHLFAFKIAATALPITLLSIGFMERFVDRRHFADFGLQLRQKTWWLDYGFGWVAGILEASSFVFIMVLLDWAEIHPADSASFTLWQLIWRFLLSLLTFAGVGIFEEVMRVYQIRNITEGLAGTRIGVVGAMTIGIAIAGFYSVIMHVASGDPVFLLFIFITGVIYGLFYLWTGRAALAMAMHFAWDFTNTNIFLLGGASSGEVALFSVPIKGFAMPDAGFDLVSIVGIGAKIVGLILVVLWIRWREGTIRLRKDLATPTLRHKHSVLTTKVAIK